MVPDTGFLSCAGDPPFLSLEKIHIIHDRVQLVANFAFYRGSQTPKDAYGVPFIKPGYPKLCPTDYSPQSTLPT